MISVIIPCYNQGRFLEDAVKSILAQTYTDVEIIIVDDCSTDDTLIFCTDVMLLDKRVKVFRHNKNLGKSIALNTGIMASRGQYITILDADDMREPDAVAELLNACVMHPKHFAYDDMIVYVNGQKGKVWKFPEYDFNEQLVRNTVHTGIMFPREAFEETGGYPVEFNRGREDWAFNILLGTKGYCGIHVPYAGYIYRRGEQNRTLTNTTPEWKNHFENQIRKRFSDLYSGRFPMGCCGHRDPYLKSETGVPVELEKLVGSDGMTAIEYLGGNYGTQTYYGAITGTGYKFDAANRTKMVDNRDLATEKGTGLLDLREHTKALFKISDNQPEPIIPMMGIEEEVHIPVEEIIAPAPVEEVEAIPVPTEISKVDVIPVTTKIGEVIKMPVAEGTPLETKIKPTNKNLGKLTAAGFSTVEQVVAASVEELVAKTGLSSEMINKLKEIVTK